MGMRVSILIGGVISSLAFHNVGFAQTLGEVPTLPRLEDVKPLSGGMTFADGFFHDFVLSTELGLGHTRAKDGQPANQRQSSVTSLVNLSFGMGEMGFASLTGNLSKEHIDSQVANLPAVPLGAGAVSRGFDAMFGIAPVPYLRFGLMGGIGDATASYTYYPVGFGVFPGPDSTSTSRRLGAFAGASYLAGPVLLNADVSYLMVDNSQDYGPTNWPQYVDWGTDLLTVSLGARYFVAPRLELNGNLSLHHIVDQVVPSGDSPNGTDWATLQLGAKYALTDQMSVDIKGTTAIGNDKFDYQRVSLGFSYRF